MKQKTSIELDKGEHALVTAESVQFVTRNDTRIVLTAVELETIHAAMLECKAVADIQGAE